jgi:hypothetical protein
MNEKILKIPYEAVREDWDLLQNFLVIKGNPRYIIVGDVDLVDRLDIFDLGNLVGVEGALNLSWSDIKSLGNLEYVEGHFSLNGCKKIKTLGKIKKVDGYVGLDESSIESLGELEFVKGDLSLYYCENIKNLGNLKKVLGDLNLRFSSIESLGDLEFVGNDLWVEGTNIPSYEINNVNVAGNIVR